MAETGVTDLGKLPEWQAKLFGLDGPETQPRHLKFHVTRKRYQFVQQNESPMRQNFLCIRVKPYLHFGGTAAQKILWFGAYLERNLGGHSR